MSADDENPHDDKPLEDEAMDVTSDHPNQTQETAPTNEEKNSENEEGQFEAENNEGDISASELNNVQTENAGEENSAKAVRKSRLKLILPLYLIGLISLSIAALGFCFAPFTEYVHANYKFVPTSNFLWIWICAIIAGAIFLIDLIVVLSLKGAKRIGSLKKLFLARFSLPLAASVIACVIIGLVGGTSYYNRYKAEELARKEYGENDKTLTTPITSPSTILGQAYNQCYPPMGVTESGSYYIDSYEASITGEAGTLTGGATSAELLQTTIELGCVLNALNIQSPQSGTSALNYLLTNAALNASSKNSMMGQKNLVIKHYEISVITMITSNLSAPSPLAGIIFTIAPHPMLTGYKWNTAILPNIDTINEEATYNSSASSSISVLGGLLNGLDQALGGGGGPFSPIFSNSSNDNSNLNSNGNNNGNSNNQNAFSGETSSSSTSTTPNSSSQNASSSPTNSPNMNGSSGSNTDSSSPTDHSSDADAALNATRVCANKGPNTYSNESDSGSPFVTTFGTKEWGQMMACVAQQSQMPSSIEIGLKNFLSNYVSALKNNSAFPAGGQMNWWLNDGSEITVSYGGSTTVNWLINFWVTNSPSANNNNNN